MRIRISDPYLWLMDPDPEGPKHADPADPVLDQDPQHWLKHFPKSNTIINLLLPIEHDRHFLRHNEVHIAA